MMCKCDLIQPGDMPTTLIHHTHQVICVPQKETYSPGVDRSGAEFHGGGDEERRHVWSRKTVNLMRKKLAFTIFLHALFSAFTHFLYSFDFRVLLSSFSSFNFWNFSHFLKDSFCGTPAASPLSLHLTEPRYPEVWQFFVEIEKFRRPKIRKLKRKRK